MGIKVGSETIDDKAADRAVATNEIETDGEARYVDAVEFDQEHGVVADRQCIRTGARLGVTVDQDGLRDLRQHRCRCDRVNAGALNIENNPVDAAGRVRITIGIEDRLAQRVRSAVVRVRYRKGLRDGNRRRRRRRCGGWGGRRCRRRARGRYNVNGLGKFVIRLVAFRDYPVGVRHDLDDMHSGAERSGGEIFDRNISGRVQWAHREGMPLHSVHVELNAERSPG